MHRFSIRPTHLDQRFLHESEKSKPGEKSKHDSVYANIGPRSKRASALLNSSDYGALCDHTSNAKAPSVVDEDDDVYATAQQYYKT